MGNIPETGVIDYRTNELMSKPRCGVKDELDIEPIYDLMRHRRKRYVTAPGDPKWEKNDLTYR